MKVIVAQSEITAIHYRRRRQLHLPVERGEFGELRPCPLEVGDLRKLQTAPGQKSTAITVVSVELTQRQEGPAWLVTFALGDRTEFYDKHRERYLKRKGAGTTTDLKKALKTEPAVTSEEELRLAARAREKRELEERQRLLGLAGQMESLRRTSDDEACKRMLKRNIRNIHALLKVPSDAGLDSSALQHLGSNGATSRRPGQHVVLSPDTAQVA